MNAKERRARRRALARELESLRALPTLDIRPTGEVRHRSAATRSLTSRDGFRPSRCTGKPTLPARRK